VREPPFSGVRESFFTSGIACGALEGVFNQAGLESSICDDDETREAASGLEGVPVRLDQTAR
jgi:hypothetical protein